jgi:hypothetical protein
MRQDNPTKLFQYDTAEAVLKEALEILKLISPGFNLVTVIDVFNAADRIYKGKYPGYRACNTDYHDFAHVCAVFLAMARLIHGAVIVKATFTERHIVLGLIAAIMHDVGYIQEEFDREGTGAKYTASHVQRSMDFLSCHGSDYGLSSKEIDAARDIILCTDLAVDISAIRFPDSQTELLGKMLGTADLLAQLADRLYLEKLLFLYYEYKEGEVGDYKSELDVLKNAVGFYDLFEERLNTKLDAADRFMISHFTARWNIKKNLYHEEIERQKNFLLKILEMPDADPRDFLKRGGIVVKVRQKYRPKKQEVG